MNRPTCLLTEKLTTLAVWARLSLPKGDARVVRLCRHLLSLLPSACFLEYGAYASIRGCHRPICMV
jgi:hypothetical protein